MIIHKGSSIYSVTQVYFVSSMWNKRNSSFYPWVLSGRQRTRLLIAISQVKYKMSLKIQNLMKMLTSAKSNSQEFHKNQPLQYSLNNAFLQHLKAKTSLMGFRKEQWFQKMRKYDDVVLNATHLCCHHHNSPPRLSSTVTHTHTPS